MLLDIDDDSDEEEDIIHKSKTGKRGRIICEDDDEYE